MKAQDIPKLKQSTIEKHEVKEMLEEKFYKIFSDENEDQDPMFLEHFHQLSKTCASIAESEAVKFAEWIRDKMYVRYFGSEKPDNNKWYRQYTMPPGRILYTTSELYLLFKESTK